MPSLKECGAGTLLLAVLVFPACNREKKTREERNVEPATMPAPGAPAESETTPSSRLDAADKSFAKKDLDKAVEELRLAAIDLRNAAEHASAGARRDLLDAAHTLERAGNDIGNKTITTTDALERRLAAANASLAHFHYLRSLDAEAARDPKTAGREMIAALDELERGTKRLGHDVTGAAASFGDHARDVGRKLVRDGKIAESDIAMTMRGLKREIDQLVSETREHR
jgi:hypothetical protein